MRSKLTLLLLLLSVGSGFAQSYGDLKAAYDEKVVYIDLLTRKISALEKKAALTHQADSVKVVNLSAGLTEANHQTGIRSDSLSTMRQDLSACETERTVLATELKKYRPQTWVGRRLKDIGTSLKWVGVASLVGGALKLFIF